MQIFKKETFLNKRGAFEKQGQRYTCKIYLVQEIEM